MKMPDDPRLPMLSTPDYNQALNARLYDLFRQIATVLNSPGGLTGITASAVSVSPIVGLSADNVQAALEELASAWPWLGTPVGGYITPYSPPPTDDPRFRYVLCTAGETGAGGYNEGVLVNESVTGSGALIIANADIALAGSPMFGLNIPLINTDSRFIGAGEVEALESDSVQNIVGDRISIPNLPATPPTGAFQVGADAGTSYTGGPAVFKFVSLDVSRVARTSDRTKPKGHIVPHYRRIF